MEPLLDPCNDRQVPSVEPPPSLLLSDEVMWADMDVPNWEVIRDHMKKEGKLHKEQVMRLCETVLEITKKEPTLVHMEEPIGIVGDIHGQYYDLCHMIEKAGKPKKINYLFLGDYVDRGIFSMEVVILLLALKINYPEKVVLLRGNHEGRNMTQHFTFREEAIRKFDEEVYQAVMEVFDAMPLAALVNKKYLALHGGISPDLKKLDNFEKINRFSEPPTEGLFGDVLWSDPLDDTEALECDYRDNEEREGSYMFGRKPVK